MDFVKITLWKNLLKNSAFSISDSAILSPKHLRSGKYSDFLKLLKYLFISLNFRLAETFSSKLVKSILYSDSSISIFSRFRDVWFLAVLSFFKICEVGGVIHGGNWVRCSDTRGKFVSIKEFNQSYHFSTIFVNVTVAICIERLCF